MKLLVVTVVSFWDLLSDVAAWLLSWLGNGDTAQVIFTMGLFPIFMNIIQFWVIDSIIKVGGLGAPPDEPDEPDHEPLFNSIDDPNEDEDEEDMSGEAAKHDIEAQAQRLRHSADSSHTYPPSLPSSPTVSPPVLSRSLPLVQRRRASPARSTGLQVLNSQSLPSRASESVGARMKEDWQPWGSEEDWPDRFEEEEDLLERREGEGS